MACGHWDLLRDAGCGARTAAMVPVLTSPDQLSQERVILGKLYQVRREDMMLKRCLCAHDFPCLQIEANGQTFAGLLSELLS